MKRMEVGKGWCREKGRKKERGRRKGRNVGHDLRNENDYYLPHPRLEFFRKIPLFSLPAARNDAGDINLQHNRKTFKIALKDKLLDEIWQEIL